MTPNEDKLPIDLRTFLLGLWLRRRMAAVFIVVSGVLGLATGLLLGHRTFEAETVLLYKPMTDPKNPFPVPSVFTFMNMVNIQSSLEEVNRRLGLETTPQALDARCEVAVEKNSDLMIIRAQANSAEEAAAIANALRDIFLDNQRNVRKSEAAQQARDLEARLESVRRQLKQADGALHEFTAANKLINLDKETQSYLEQLASMDILYENAQIEKMAIETKAANLDKLVEDVRSRLAKEQLSSQSEAEKIREMSIRIERLRDAINEDRFVRSALADLAQKELDLEHAKKLQAQGVISSVEYEKAVSSYERQKALAVDTAKVKDWRSEMEKLQQTIVSSDSSSSATMLKEILLKSFDIRLDLTVTGEKVKKLQAARDRIKTKLEALPKLQRQYVDLSREVASREAEKQGLETMLAQQRRISESESPDFGTVSAASPPAKPIRSTRSLLCLAVACAGTLLGFGVMVLLELSDTSVKSGADFALKLPCPLLGMVPELPRGRPVFPDQADFEPAEPFKMAARRVRNSLPKKGARLLIVSAANGEGKSVVGANLAASLGRQDERVLLVDAQLRQREGSHEFRSLITEEGGSLKGLGEYLSFDADKADEIIWPTFLAGVECLPRIGTTAVPDFLGSHRMRELLEDLSGRFNLILVEVPAALHYADAEALARWADAILFVVGSRTCKAAVLKKILDRLAATGTPVVGAILNRVNPLYLENK